MKAILILFQSIFAYLSYFAMVLPIISIINAQKKRLIKDFDLRLFAVYILVGSGIQFFIIAFAWYVYLNYETYELFRIAEVWLFRFYVIFQTSILVFLCMKWANYQKYYPAAIVIIYILLFAGDSFAYSEYPDIMAWISCSVILMVSYTVNYKIDNGSVQKLDPSYNYLVVGIYLYCMISIFGITPNQSELRNLGHVLHSVAVIVSSYYYFLAFKSLYKQENLSIIVNT